MSTVKSIREKLGVTQTALAVGMGCTQGNVGHYERGQTVYLEEDCDLALFFDAYRNHFGRDPEYITNHTDGSSPIRSYHCFLPLRKALTTC